VSLQVDPPSVAQFCGCLSQLKQPLLFIGRQIPVRMRDEDGKSRERLASR